MQSIWLLLIGDLNGCCAKPSWVQWLKGKRQKNSYGHINKQAVEVRVTEKQSAGFPIGEIYCLASLQLLLLLPLCDLNSYLSFLTVEMLLSPLTSITSAVTFEFIHSQKKYLFSVPVKWECNDQPYNQEMLIFIEFLYFDMNRNYTPLNCISYTPQPDTVRGDRLFQQPNLEPEERLALISVCFESGQKSEVIMSSGLQQ